MTAVGEELALPLTEIKAHFHAKFLTTVNKIFYK